MLLKSKEESLTFISLWVLAATSVRNPRLKTETLLGHRRQCQLQSATTRRGYVMMTSLLLLHCWMPDVHFPLLMEPHETCSEGFILDTSLLTGSRAVFRLNSPDVCGLKDSPMFVRALEPESPPKKYLRWRVNRGELITLVRRALKAVYVMPSALWSVRLGGLWLAKGERDTKET